MGIDTKIPVIDLEDFPNQSSNLIKACENWGCFRIVNHEKMLPVSLMQEMKVVVRSLLDLPSEIKKRNTDVIVGSGYMAPSQVNPLYEALGLYDMASVDVVNEFCIQLDASPQQRYCLNVHSEDMTNTLNNRDTIVRYAQAVNAVMIDIGQKLGESLALANVPFQEWPCQFRINKYNFTDETVGSYGVQIHTDSGFFTILQDDENVGGLEVMNKSGTYVPVDPWLGTLLVNLGDMATLWSNGRFCNVKHRVLCKEAATRISIASFLLGPKETAVEPPPELVGSSHSRLYTPITYEDYRKMRISTKMQAGEALELIRSDSKYSQ
ncbi:hypothetical protein Leryth_013019 [Lithospermum erythrorhizon]|nr:hypothetical protein Leryth_013019 [Lithospermum erythrorhizon]